MKATNSKTNKLVPIKNCFLSAKGRTVYATVLPELSDKHAASYADEQIMGRSMPVKTYASSSDRTITWKWKFVNTDRETYVKNLEDYNFLKSLTYPIDTPSGPVPYEPPPICNIRCGSIFSGTGDVSLGLDVVCTDCSASFPTDVAWTSYYENEGEDEDFMPIEFSVDTTFSVVYRADNLPGQGRIMTYGG
jgi:hypothetical protein